MIVNFNIELDGATFKFQTVNRLRLQLFQVYVDHEGKKTRFHMQVGEDGEFYIADKTACPEMYYHLEPTMSEAIKKLGEVSTHVLD